MFLRIFLLAVVALTSNTVAQTATPTEEGLGPTAHPEPSRMPDVTSHLEVAIPPDCNRPNLLKQGHPVFISERRSTDFNKLRLGLVVLGSSLAYGVSLEKYVFEEGEPIRFHIWVDNPSDEAAFTLTCSDLDWFAENDFRLYDAKGHRVESQAESSIVASLGAKSVADACASSYGHDRLGPGKFCLRNVPTEIPPHTCTNTGDEDTNDSFSGDLRNMYHLQVGRYTIRTHTEATVADPCKPESAAIWFGVPGRDITFEIVPRQLHR